MSSFTGFTADTAAVNAEGTDVVGGVAGSFADGASSGGAPPADERSGGGDLPSPFVPEGGVASPAAPPVVAAAARVSSSPISSTLALAGASSSRPSLDNLAVIPGTLVELQAAATIDPILAKLLDEIGA